MAVYEIVKQVLCLGICLSLVQEQKSLLCEDQASMPSGDDEPLAEFSPYLRHYLPGPKKISFQQLSVSECAHLCLQVAKGKMFNCSSFEHVATTRDCLLIGSSCEGHKLMFDNTIDFYQLEGPNGMVCSTLSLSSYLPPSLIQPTSTIQTSSVVSSIVANKNVSGSHNLSIQVTLLLTNESWKVSLTNRSSYTFINISSRIKQNVFQTLENFSSLLEVTVLQLRNTSGLVSAEFSVTFSQKFQMRHMNRFYSSLHNTQRLGLMTIDVINDTIPGKPPENLNVTINSPTVLHLSWSPKETEQIIDIWGLRIVYKAIDDNKTRSILVDQHRAEVNISQLHPDTRYSIWTVCVTSKGFGFPSQVLNVTTPRIASQDIIIQLRVLLTNVTWDAKFENRSSEAFGNLSSLIENGFRFIHRNDSFYKNSSSLRFSNHSAGTIVFINAFYDHSSRMKNFNDIYEALYKKKRLQVLQVEVIDDNIPGKPPTNITPLALSPSSITVNWSLPRSNHCEVFSFLGFRVYYAFTDNKNVTFTHFVDVNKSNRHVVIQNLEHFEYYLIWLQTITSRGVGPKSEAVKTRTLEQVVRMNMTIKLDVPWTEALLNDTSDAFKNITTRIQRNVYLLYKEMDQLRRVVCNSFINDSGKVAAEVEITYGQHVQMSAFILLYEMLYENGTLGNMTATPISDNIPGKPPTNMSVEAINPTNVLIRWKFSSPSHEPAIPTTALRIFYKLLQGNSSVTNIKDTNATTGFVVLDKLEKFSWYTVWIKSATYRGLGGESKRFKIRTLEEVVPVNITVRLPDEEWTEDLSNTSSETFVNLSRKLESSVEEMYRNETHLRDIAIHSFRNDSEKVVAGIEIIFGQHVEMKLFITLYQALYRNGSFGDLSVQPIWDSIPGKPPQNISAHATSTTSIRVEWNTVPHDWDVILLKVFYITTSQHNETILWTDVNLTESDVEIRNLAKFVNYTVWIRSVSRWGLGISSYQIYVRTLEEVVPVNLTVRIDNVNWNRSLSDPGSENFKNLTRTIQQNIFLLYGQESSYLRDVQCHRFINGSVLADMTIVYGQSVGPEQFATLYKALYEDGTIGNLSVQPVRDNVPGKPPRNVSAESNTSTSIKVTWLCADCHQHNSTIGFLISYKLTSSNQTSAVTVNRTVRDFLISGLKKFTNYTIYVTSVTLRGVSMSSNKLSIRTLEDVPSLIPAHLRAHNMSSTSLFVAWDPLPEDQVNGILLGYKVTYSKHREIHARKQNISTILNITILSGLDKFTAYDVHVSAFTRVGNGPEANVTAFTDQDVPSLPPTDIRAYNTSSTSLIVTWSPVSQGFAHGIVLGYMVLYKRQKDVNNSYINITSLVTSAQLTDLDKFTMYVVKVLAFTVKGNGAMTNETRARTHEDVPSLPPIQLSAHNTSSTSLMITWLPVPDGYVHGILQGYRLMFKFDQDSFYQNVTTVNQSFELMRLEKFTNYSVKVLAFTRIGDGNVSKPVTVSTNEDVPSLPPQNVSSHNTSSTSLHVSWHEVPHGFVHGILLGYRVLYKVAGGINTNNSVASTSASIREKELQELKKFTIYEITVLAFTRIGDGANSTSIYVSTDEDIPSQPPTDLAAHNTSSTSLQVTWGEVPKGFVHGILQGYRVFYKKTGDQNSSYVNSTTGPTERELHITGLEKFTAYSVKVLAFTRKGDGAVSVNISILTDEDVPSLPPQSVQSYNTSSTSVNVTWHEVPAGFVHGILRGYRVFYSKTKHHRATVTHAVVPPNQRYVHLTGLSKFTNYTIQVAAFTRIGYGALSPDVIVSTDEDVPSLPPQNLWANNISSTALIITWNPVPLGFVHGILRGYRVLYKKTNEPSAPYTKITVSRGVRIKEIYGLKKFTYYTIRVLAFTIKGDGAQSPPVNVSTDEDIPSEQPQNVFAKDKASPTIIYMSWESPPEHTIHGILRGYYIWYSIISLGIHDKNPVFPQDYKRKQLPAESKSDALTDLESYATYHIRIAAFTSKGYGPIKNTTTRTCRCRSTIPTNWWNNPPYVSSHPHSNSSKESGILPTILELVVPHCCQWCGDFETTTIDLTTDADGLEAQKVGVTQVKDAIRTKTMISFGIAGVMPQEKYNSPDGEAEYVPIMETPGVAFIVAEKRDIHKEVLLAILSCWPAVVIACIMTYLAGIVVWALDMKWNHVDFPKSFFSGSLEGFWWSFVTMTTVGYGDRIPKSIPARMFAFLWTWTGIATIAVITSSITASLMSMVFQPERMLYGTKVAAITNSSEYKLGLRRNAILDPDRSYGNLYDLYEDLENDRVHAALLDSYSTASESKMFSKDWLRVIEIIPVRYESANGVVLTGDAMRLARCFRRYVKSETSKIHRIIQQHVGTIEAGDVPFAVKTSSELLTEESYLYKRTVIILGSSLGAFTLAGLIWHFCFYKKTISPQPSDIDGQVAVVKPQISRHEIREQLKQDVAEFYATFRQKYLALRRKHIKELKELRRLTKDHRGTELRRLPEFSANRKGQYVVTKDADVNSIFEGLDMSIFDKRSSKRWRV